MSSRKVDYGGPRSWIYREGETIGTPEYGYIPFLLVTEEFPFDGTDHNTKLKQSDIDAVLGAIDVWNFYTVYKDPITGEEQGTRLIWEPFLSKIEDAKAGTGYQLAIDKYVGKSDTELQEIVDRHGSHFVRISVGGVSRANGFVRANNYILNGEPVTYQVVQAGGSIRTSAHEFLHVMGHSHEQGRTDRSKYIWLIDGDTSQNGMRPELVSRGCYDAESIMHYNRMQLYSMPSNAPNVVISRGDRMCVRAQTQSARMEPFGEDNYYQVNNRFLEVSGANQWAENPNILLNDGDWNGDLFKAFIDQQPTKGVITKFDGNKGTFTYIPNEGTSGLDEFTYKLTKINHTGYTSPPIKVKLHLDPLELVVINGSDNLNPGERQNLAVTVKNHSSSLDLGFAEAENFYTVTNSNIGGVSYNWTDISSTGTILNSVSQSNRNKTETIDLDWSFNFYGKSYSNIKVGAWGNIFFEKDYWHKLANSMNRDEMNLDFDAQYESYTQRNPYNRGTGSNRNGYYGWEGLPRRGEQVNDMAVLVGFGKMVNPLKDELATNETHERGQVYFKKETDKIIIQYTNMPEIEPDGITPDNFTHGKQLQGNGIYTYQIILHKNGEIEMQYYAMSDAHTDPRYYIGLQDEKGKNDFYVCKETTFLPNSQFAIKLTQNPAAVNEQVTLGLLEERTFMVTAEMDANAKPGDLAEINQLFSYTGNNNYGGGRIDSNINIGTIKPKSGLVITELFIDPWGSNFDTNKSMSSQSWKDEFIEIVNASMQNISLDGYTLSDSNTGIVNHTFPSGTDLKPGQSIVVIGNGYNQGAYPELEDYVIFQNAITLEPEFLHLDDDGDIVELRDSSGNLVDVFDYTNEGTSSSTSQSLVRIPEIGGSNIELHSAVYSANSVIPGDDDVIDADNKGDKIKASIGLSAAENKPFASLVSMASPSIKALESSGKFDFLINFESGFFGDSSDIVVGLTSGNAGLLKNYAGDVMLKAEKNGQSSFKVSYEIAEGGISESIETLVFSVKSATGRTLILPNSTTTVNIHYNGNGDDGSALIITELLHDPNGMNKDHNRNGYADETNKDEYIEIVNAGSSSVNMSGFIVEDNYTVRHIFPQGTILGPYQALVLFGDDDFNPAPFVNDFPEIIFQGINQSNGLGFGSSSVDFGRLKDSSGNEISMLDYRNKLVSTGDNQAIMRYPEVYGGNEDLIFHNENTIALSSVGKTSTGRSYPSLVSMADETIQVLESAGTFDVGVNYENGFFNQGSDIVVELVSGDSSLLTNYTGPITLTASEQKDGILKYAFGIVGGEPLGTSKRLQFDIRSATNAFIMPNSTLNVDILYSGPVLSIEDGFGVINKNNNVSLYPNPTTGILNIVNHNNKSINNIRVHNMQGQIIYQSQKINYSEASINLSHLNHSGVLIIAISLGNETSYHKIVILK